MTIHNARLRFSQKSDDPIRHERTRTIKKTIQAGTPKFPTQTLLLYFGTEQRITLTIWHRNLNHTRPAVDTEVDSGSQKLSKGAA